MENKVTKKTLTYPKGYEPDYIIPKEYCEYRFILGKRGQNSLVAICMNPSAARKTFSDRTVNRIINISKSLKKMVGSYLILIQKGQLKQGHWMILNSNGLTKI